MFPRISYWIVISVFISLVKASIDTTDPIHNNGFDLNLYEEVLDPEECIKQISYISTDTTLQFQFVDAGPRFPRRILLGNLMDLGSYHECLGINYQTEDMSIEGKYCLMNIPLSQSIESPEIGLKTPWPNPHIEELFAEQLFDDKTLKDLIVFEKEKNALRNLVGYKTHQNTFASRDESENSTAGLSFNIALCIPKVCTTQQALAILTLNLTDNLDIEESFCRLPNDKPRVAADYVAIVIFSIIGLLSILSTGYDIWYTILQKNDPKKANKICMLFSIYTNTRQFFTFANNPNAINCLDGIRSISMLWVIIGHTFVNEVVFIPANPLHVLDFITAFSSLWITSGTICVDTFFMLTGLLLVYTTVHKLSRSSLVKNLHLFYLNRLLRMFPVLATAVLLQASFFNRISDGPVWNQVVELTNDCRQYWWTTLLYVQNFVNPLNTCLPHSWYLAIDMQLYFLSPIVLYWLLGDNRKAGWISIVGCLLAVLTGATIYNFIMEFPSSSAGLSRPEDSLYYLEKYYMNTLTRASPFIVGMILGYIMHIYRGQTVHIPKLYVILLWLLATVTSSTVIISHYFGAQFDWDNQTVDSILNSFMRPAWAACLGWLIFACKHGYSGPIDWFLSLHIFKILGRLSYAMYITHYLIQFILSGTELAPVYFSVEFSIYKFFIDLSLSVIASLIIMILIDAPCSGIIGIFLGGSKHRKRTEDIKTKNLNGNATLPVSDISKKSIIK